MHPQRAITSISYWDPDRPLWANIGMIIGSVCPIATAIFFLCSDYTPTAFLCLIPTVLFALVMAILSVIDSIQEGLEARKKTGHSAFVVVSFLIGLLQAFWVFCLFFMRMLMPAGVVIFLWGTWKYGISGWFTK